MRIYILLFSFLFLIKKIIICTVLDDHLLAHYKFAGNFEDSTGNYVDATASSIVWTLNKDGDSNKAVQFSNNNAYIRLPETIVNGLVDYSITFWAKSLNETYNINGCFFSFS